jgi:hypothetical protein
MSRYLSDLTSDTQAAVDELLTFARSRGLNPKIVYTRRSCAEQNALYAQGRTTPGNIVTGAQGCRSWHVLGRAVDIDIGSNNCADYAELGAFWKSIGGVWGGDFPNIKDCVHFELRHPTLPLDALCPDPSPGNCEIAAATEHPFGLSPSTLAVFGAAFGAALALAVTSPTRKLRSARAT